MRVKNKKIKNINLQICLNFLAKFITQIFSCCNNYALSLPRVIKQGFVIVLDILLCTLTVWLAFYLRLGEWVSLIGPAFWAVVASILLAIPLFMKLGLYRAIFRYSGASALMILVRAMVLYFISFATIFTFWGVDGIPRTVGLIQPLLLLLLIAGSRAIAGVWLGGLYSYKLRRESLPQTLIYGAGSAGRQLASTLSNSSEINVVGFLDDDSQLQGQILNGLPILNPADLDEILKDSTITNVLLAIPSVSRSRRNEILNTLKLHRVAVRTLPHLSDIAMGKVALGSMRELDIDDLLSREPVQPNWDLLSLNTHQKTVMVTGAGGSIGSELCRQILAAKPRRLLMVDISEFALYQIHKELISLLSDGLVRKELIQLAALGEPTNEPDQELNVSGIEIIPLLASVCDELRMHEIISTWKPNTIYHAAAYKHVPLVEHNPSEGIRNNVFGTRVCAEEALLNGVDNFVLVSTDKAVRPTNIMGATKRLAELILQALAENEVKMATRGGNAFSSKTTFSIVRFGNVLGSSGSVVPLFREQIKNGGPITLTHVDMTRYFMTIPEAAQLVIQSGAMGLGGDVFVLEMGPPLKIIDLARRMVELSGLTIRDELHPYGDIELSVTGLRPGEKLFEELLIGKNPKPTQHPRIMKAHEQFLPWITLEKKLTELSFAVSNSDVVATRLLLKDLVREYNPTGEVVDWVHIATNRY